MLPLRYRLPPCGRIFSRRWPDCAEEPCPRCRLRYRYATWARPFLRYRYATW